VQEMIICRGCGVQLHRTALACPKCGAPQHSTEGRRSRGFTGSVVVCINQYATFKGRAPRAEYWYFVLFTILLGFGAGIVDAVWLGNSKVVANVVSLAFLLPTVAVHVRRLHDLDRVGWWLWLWLVPIIGWLILFVWACTAGKSKTNRFGPDPLAA